MNTDKSSRKAAAQVVNVLDDELTAMQQVYIASTMPKLGSADPWADPFFELWETCMEFEAAKEPRTGLYVGEDEYPDSFNHGRWLAHQQHDWKALGYDITRAKIAFEDMDHSRDTRVEKFLEHREILLSANKAFKAAGL